MKQGIHPDYRETTGCALAGTPSPPAALRSPAPSMLMSARSATRSTPASRRFLTLVAASLGSSAATARRTDVVYTYYHDAGLLLGVMVISGVTAPGSLKAGQEGHERICATGD